MRKDCVHPPVIASSVVGATGAVGTEMLNILNERKFPVDRVMPLASSKSAGATVSFGDEELTVKLLTKDSFRDIDIALFSAGSDVSTEYAPIAAKSGAVVVPVFLSKPLKLLFY